MELLMKISKAYRDALVTKENTQLDIDSDKALDRDEEKDSDSDRDKDRSLFKLLKWSNDL